MKRTLLVIDIQNDYFPGGALPLWEPEEVETRIASAIGLARASGDKVILVQHVSTATTGLFASGGSGIAIRPAILAAAAAAAAAADADADADAPIITKRYADAFQDTDLAEHLGATEELLVCGMMTQNCVVFTALSRAADGLGIKVVGDLCTAPTEAVHRIALNALRSKTEVVIAADIWV